MGDLHIFKITVGGVERSYFVHVPPNYEDATKWPVVVMFHGGGGTAKGAMRETGWAEKAEKEGFLAVFPEAMLPYPARPFQFGENQQTWNCGSKLSIMDPATFRVADVEFVSTMLADLKMRFSVDERRIYATGFSNGGAMTFRLARELSPIIAAAAPVACHDWVDDKNPECPISLLYITGTTDPLNPAGGGEIRFGAKPVGTRPPVSAMIDKWVKMLGCPEEGRVVYSRNGATGIAYGLPGETAEVVVYTIVGHGHHWPGGRSALPVSFAGENTARLNATDVIWEFLKAHPKVEKNDSQRDGGHGAEKLVNKKLPE